METGYCTSQVRRSWERHTRNIFLQLQHVYCVDWLFNSAYWSTSECLAFVLSYLMKYLVSVLLRLMGIFFKVKKICPAQEK